MQFQFSVALAVVTLLCSCAMKFEESNFREPMSESVSIEVLLAWNAVFEDWSKQAVETPELGMLKDYKVYYHTTPQAVTIWLSAKRGKEDVGLRGGRTKYGVDINYTVRSGDWKIVKKTYNR
jgi:hypothetical protein